MIEQLPFILTLSGEHLARLEGKKPWSGSQWTDDDVTLIKSEIRRQLQGNQDCCAYCGLPFKGSKDMQIEHIAAKAFYRHPRFTFTLQNLVLSCGYCNNLVVKGTKQTIELPAAINYEDCTFLLVHPYFDNPDEHYEWIEDDNNEKVLIQIRNESPKARFSIEMFDLASSGMSLSRACVAFRNRRHTVMPNSDDDETNIQLTLDFRD
jgi:uncharacterized protein (TIGR02646 family)